MCASQVTLKAQCLVTVLCTWLQHMCCDSLGGGDGNVQQGVEKPLVPAHSTSQEEEMFQKDSEAQGLRTKQ